MLKIKKKAKFLNNNQPLLYFNYMGWFNPAQTYRMFSPRFGGSIYEVDETGVLEGNLIAWRKIWLLTGNPSAWRKPECLEEIRVLRGDPSARRKPECLGEIRLPRGNPVAWRKPEWEGETFVYGGKPGAWKHECFYRKIREFHGQIPVPQGNLPFVRNFSNILLYFIPMFCFKWQIPLF